MGPQLYRCGNRLRRCLLASKWQCFNGAATLSLRKQPDDPAGSPPDHSFNGAATLSLRKLHAEEELPIRFRVLQWGRNFIVAETVYAAKYGRMEIKLQWGRNFIVAETRMLNQFSAIIYMLQWGRNFIVAETRPRPARASGGSVASMGPQLYRCGNGTLGPIIGSDYD